MVLVPTTWITWLSTGHTDDRLAGLDHLARRHWASSCWAASWRPDEPMALDQPGAGRFPRPARMNGAGTGTRGA